MSWADWREEVAKACDGSHHTIESIEHELSTGAHCLLEIDGGCYIVSLERYPATTTCQIWWAAGDMDTLVKGLPKVEAWAWAHGCKEVLIEGNPAWQRVLKPHRYGVWSVTLRKAIHGPVH